MAVYKKDDPKLFLIALQSIFDNSLLPKEFVLVADGPLSSDLYSVIDLFKDRKEFKLIELESNLGLANALNQGMRHINSDWVFRADSDDYNLPNRFLSLANAIIDSKLPISIIGSYVSEHDQSGNFLSLKKVPIDHSAILRKISIRNPFNHMSVAFTKAAFNAVGGYPNVYLKEDYALWISMVAKGFIGLNLPVPLVKATTGSSFYIRRSGWRSASSEFEIYKTLHKNGLASNPLVFVVFLSRFFVLLLPSFMVRLVYITFLRR
jgi:glycosyltransferase involved in cell wall biosynthesis